MNDRSLPTANPIDQALGLLIADGQAAAELARQLLTGPVGPLHRAAALAVLAMVQFREGELAEGLRLLAEGRATLLAAGPPTSPTASPHPNPHPGPYSSPPPSTKAPDPAARAAALLDHAEALGLRRSGQLAEAELLLTALDKRAEQRPVVDAYVTASALGIVRSMRGDDDGALEHFYPALALARRSGITSLVVNALNNLGSLQSDLANFEDAAPLLEECLHSALALGSRRQIIYAAGNLVQCLCLMGQAPRALALAQEHLIGRIRPDDPPALQRDEEIAQALLDNGRVDEAEARLEGPQHVDPMSNETATVRVWLQARIRLARGDADGALALTRVRSQVLQQGEDASTVALDRIELLRVGAKAAAQLGADGEAYALLHQAFALHEQMLGRAARARRASLQITHRLQQAEWERDAARRVAERLAALNTTLTAQIAENERLQQQLKAQALEDPLTGLPNRRHLVESSRALLAQAQRQGGVLALAVIDLDHFKQVNDRHGHETGDRVLRGFAALLRRQIRATDLAARLGGEEFVVLLPDADAHQAAERLRAVLEQFHLLAFEGAGHSAFTCSFSAGVAGWPMDGLDLDSLLARADQRLYAAKAAGRSRVHAEP